MKNNPLSNIDKYYFHITLNLEVIYYDIHSKGACGISCVRDTRISEYLVQLSYKSIIYRNNKQAITKIILYQHYSIDDVITFNDKVLIIHKTSKLCALGTII